MASWIEAKGTGRKVTRHELAHVFASGISCTCAWTGDGSAPKATIRMRMNDAGRNWAIIRGVEDFATLHKRVKVVTAKLAAIPKFPTSSKPDKAGQTRPQLLDAWLKALLRTALPVMALDAVHDWCGVSGVVREALETGSCRRTALTPGIIRYKGWATKLGGNKEVGVVWYTNSSLMGCDRPCQARPPHLFPRLSTHSPTCPRIRPSAHSSTHSSISPARPPVCVPYFVHRSQDPYDEKKGNWKRRYFVLTDQLLVSHAASTRSRRVDDQCWRRAHC